MIYELSRIVFHLILVFYFRWQVIGRKNILGARGGIIAVNHTSILDPTIVGVPIPGKIYYMAKKELFENRFIGWYFKNLSALPLDRLDPNISTLKKLIKLIKDGNLVLMFPEGTRSLDGSLGKGRLGIGLLAAKSKAMIYPCYIMGADKALPKGAWFFRPRKVRIIYGSPVKYDNLYNKALRKENNREIYEEISRHIMEEIDKLKRQMEEKYKE